MLEAFHLFRCCLFLLFFFVCQAAYINESSPWLVIYIPQQCITHSCSDLYHWTMYSKLHLNDEMKVRNFMSLQTLYRNLLQRITGVSKMSMRYKLILWHIQCFLCIDLERSCQVLAVQLPKPNVQPGSRVRTNSLQCQDLHRWPCSLTALATPATVNPERPAIIASTNPQKQCFLATSLE